MAMLTHVNAVPVWLYQMPVHTEYAEYTPSRAVAHRAHADCLPTPHHYDQQRKGDHTQPDQTRQSGFKQRVAAAVVE